MRKILALVLVCNGCATHVPIERAAILNESISRDIASLSRFDKYVGVEDEQSQLKEALYWKSRDVNLVADCLKHRGGITNPICRADKKETVSRELWINASTNRGIDDLNRNPKASERTKRRARKTFRSIQVKSEKVRILLDEGGLLVTRYSYVPSREEVLRSRGIILPPYDAKPPLVEVGP